MEQGLKGRTGRRLRLYTSRDSPRTTEEQRDPPTLRQRGIGQQLYGYERGEAKELNEMETNPNTKKVPTNEVFHVSAADLADKIIVLMQHGVDPLLLSTSTWALVQASQCQAIN